MQNSQVTDDVFQRFQCVLLHSVNETLSSVSRFSTSLAHTCSLNTRLVNDTEALMGDCQRTCSSALATSESECSALLEKSANTYFAEVWGTHVP